MNNHDDLCRRHPAIKAYTEGTAQFDRINFNLTGKKKPIMHSHQHLKKNPNIFLVAKSKI